MNGAYSATDLVTIIAAIGVLVSTMSAAIVQIVIAMRTNKKLDTNTAATVAAGATAEVAAAQTAEIHTLVNGNAEKAAAKLEHLERQVEQLHAAIAEHKQTAAVLAAAVAGKLAILPAGDPHADPVNVHIVNHPLITAQEPTP